MTTISKSIFSIHRSIKMKLIDVNPNMYTNLIKEDEFKVDDHVQISNYKKIFPS